MGIYISICMGIYTRLRLHVVTHSHLYLLIVTYRYLYLHMHVYTHFEIAVELQWLKQQLLAGRAYILHK